MQRDSRCILMRLRQTFGSSLGDARRHRGGPHGLRNCAFYFRRMEKTFADVV